MQDMLDDLRIDLGIPEKDDDDTSLGLQSVPSSITAARRKNRRMVQAPNKLPNLHSSIPLRRSTSPDSKPPLPRPGSRGSRSRPGSSSSLRGSGELRLSLEDPVDSGGTTASSSTFANVTALQTNEQPAADILKIDHSSGEELAGIDELDNGEQEQDEITAIIEADIKDTIAEENMSSANDEIAEVNGDLEKKMGDDEEMAPKTNLVNELTQSYQFALEDTLDDEYEDDFKEEDSTALRNSLAPIPEVDTPKESKGTASFRPTPRQRTSLNSSNDFKDTPRSQDRTTSDSIDISDLSEDDDAF